jgi:hypothetical protein
VLFAGTTHLDHDPIFFLSVTRKTRNSLAGVMRSARFCIFQVIFQPGSAALS